MKKYFGTDGIRGKANLDLTPETALRLGRAAVRAFGKKDCRIVVGRDTRVSGEMLEDALSAGIMAEGASILRAGVIPTPAIAFLTEELDADAGVVISASHNPFEDNGIKFFGPGGIKLPDETEKGIETEFEELENSGSTGGPVGSYRFLSDAEEVYLRHLLSCATLDLSGYRVALDCANGASYRVCPRVFREFGAEVEVLGDSPDGRNINRDCGSTHLGPLVELVRDWGADLGFAMDGDADRCICVDETGEVRDGDYVMAIAAGYLKEQGLLHPPLVVSTVMSNLGLSKALSKMGIESVTTRVGDRYVLEEMIKTGALIGGEQSGHIIFGEHGSTGDGTLTSIMVAAIVQDAGKSLSELADVMQKYPQVLVNVKAKTGRRLEPDMAVWDTIGKREEELDGEGRILVRSSGTEPVERVMVEAASDEEASRIAGEIAGEIDREING